MVKVLKPGKKYRIFYRATCKKCGCEFEFDKEDIQSEYDGPFSDIFESYVICPNKFCNCSLTKWEEIKEEIE